MIPSYFSEYLKHIGAASAEERVLVEASDGSALFSFKRVDHHTEVFDAPSNFEAICGEVKDAAKY